MSLPQVAYGTSCSVANRSMAALPRTHSSAFSEPGL